MSGEDELAIYDGEEATLRADATEATETPAATASITYMNKWFLMMAARVLEKHSATDRRTYELIKTIFGKKDALGLVFEDPKFALPVPNKKLVEQGREFEDEAFTINLGRKIEAIKDSVNARAAEISGHEDLPLTNIERNVHMLSAALKFTSARATLLYFFGCMSIGGFQPLIRAQYSDIPTHDDYINAISYLLGIDTKEVKDELAEDSILVGMQFLGMEKFDASATHHVQKNLTAILEGNYKSTDHLLHSLLGPYPKTELTAENFAYLGQQFTDMVATARGYVKNVLMGRKNMTFAGPPGTGKTEGAAVVAAELGVPAFLIGVARKNVDSGYSVEEPTRDDRIRALIRSAFIVRQTKMEAILVFDEAEDILRDLNTKGSKDVGSKAFTNEMLENLGVPIIFISNRTDLMDPATIRRIMPFYTMNYMPFPERVKAIIQKAEKYIGIRLTAEEVDDVAERSRDITIAIIDTALRSVAERMAGSQDRPRIIQEIRNEVIRSQTAINSGVAPIPFMPRPKAEDFDISVFSTSEDIPRLRGRFAAAKDAMRGKDFLILGPPGTGRRSLAHFFAATMGRKSRVVNFDLRGAVMAPEIVHGLDLERAALDGDVLVFDNSTDFLKIAAGHPLMDRIHAHQAPTFFIAEEGAQEKSPYPNLLAAFTFAIRTGYLSQQQMVVAGRRVLGVELAANDLKHVKPTAIGDFYSIRRQVQALAAEGDKAEVVGRLERISNYVEPVGQAALGFHN